MDVQYTVLHPQLCGQGVDLVLAVALEAAEADTWAWVGALLASGLVGWPAAVSWPAIIGAVFFAGVVGLVFGVQPARKAAGLHPVEALRG